MHSELWQGEKFYKTHPPRYLEESKIGKAFDYLIFSGSPLYLSVILENGEKIRVPETFFTTDCTDDALVINIEKPENLPLKKQDRVEVSFGYKRSRGSFESRVQEIEASNLFLEKPEAMKLSNQRRNPRCKIDPILSSKAAKVTLEASGSMGKVTYEDCELHEVSQLGMSLFVKRNGHTLLPGDEISKLSVDVDGYRCFETKASVNRVDMTRSSVGSRDSYEIVVMFEGPIRPTGQFVERTSKRTPVLEDKPCYFSAEHPFFPGRKLKGQVFEVSSSGLSCILEQTSFPVVPGMRLKNCLLQLPFCPARELVFDVAHVDFRSDGEMNQFKVGGEFVNGSIELLKDISSYVQSQRNPIIQDLNEADLDLLWEFMFETNFIYSSKRKQIQNKSREILQTYERLLSHENSIVKKLVLKEDDEIKGHISSIRFFDHAWIIQHLNALKSDSGSAALSVVQAIVDFFYDANANARNETLYVLSYFRPNNIYPAALFGESCKIINDPKKSCLVDFNFGVYDFDESHEAGSVQVRNDAADDCLELTNLLIEKNLLSFARALGLAKSDPLRLQVKGEFEKLQLERERHLVSASEDGNKVFALVETASAGLNLSELTNSITLFSKCFDARKKERLEQAALALAFRKYFEPREVPPVVLQEVSESKASAVRWSKVYTCWITSASAVPEFEKASKEVIQNLKSVIRKLAAASAEQKLALEG